MATELENPVLVVLRRIEERLERIEGKVDRLIENLRDVSLPLAYVSSH